MADIPNSPNNPNPPKKPTPPVSGPTPGAKPPVGKLEPQRPAVKPPATPAATPPTGKPAVPPVAKPVTPVGGVAPVKPGATPPAKPPAKPVPPVTRSLPKPVAKPEVKRKVWAGTEGGIRKIGQVLVDLGFVDETDMDSITEEARTTDTPVEKVAMNRGLIDDDKLLQALAEQNNLKVINLDEAKPSAAAIKQLSQLQAELYKMVPISYENDVLTVAMADPNNLQAIDDLRNLLGIMQVVPVLAPAKKVEEMISKLYVAQNEESLTDLIASLESDTTLGRVRRENSIDFEELTELQNSAPVRKLINMVLLMAIRDHASDIHFEPFEDEYKMRYRCDGVLYEMVPPPRHLAMAISSRIKVMSNLDIAERRMPQDGRIELNIGGNPVDMRVSILPTMFGESVVIRVLDRTVVSLDLEKVGLEPEMLAEFRAMINKPNGISLVTGPTGAGKTTTLYSALNELNQVTDKLITTEDPVEYEIEGIIQCPINADIGLTFAAALRAILRQDPDKILVGEIRDLETAQIAIQAALTGHMVFSTLHTNDAPSTITRLRDMGVEPYLITATVEGILAQRLVRKICTKCKTGYTPSKEQLMELNMTPGQLKNRQFFYGEGCDKCNNLGFKGRSGVFELLVMDDPLRDMISKNASTDVLRNYIRSKGVRGLREAGIVALYNGVSTIDEIVRETVSDDEG